jgi:hypothetical protein
MPIGRFKLFGTCNDGWPVRSQTRNPIRPATEYVPVPPVYLVYLATLTVAGTVTLSQKFAPLPGESFEIDFKGGFVLHRSNNSAENLNTLQIFYAKDTYSKQTSESFFPVFSHQCESCLDSALRYILILVNCLSMSNGYYKGL